MAKVTQNISKNLRLISQRVHEQLISAVYEEMGVELDESNRRAPVLTGRLVTSGSVLHPTIQGKTISCKIVYTAPYSVYVHEDLEAFHQNGEAKFLEYTFRESAPYMAERVGRRVSIAP